MTEEQEEALEIAEGLLKSNPEESATFYILGLYAYQTGDFGRAIELLNSAHKADPDCRDFADVLAVLYTLAGKIADGLYFAKLATALEPKPEISKIIPVNLSNYFEALKRIRLSTKYVEALVDFNLRKFNEAIKHCKMELRLNQDHDSCLGLMGKCHIHIGEYDKAVDALQRAIHWDPEIAEYHLDLGLALYHLGRHDEAVSCHQKALELDDESLELATKAVGAAEYLEDGSTQRKAFQKDLTKRARALPKTKLRKPSKARPKDKIRLGYISNSLFSSDAGTLISALFDHHDRNRFEIYCYQQSILKDAITTKLKVQTDSWRSIFDLKDEVMEMIIRGDEIDILVDLCGYTEGSRPSLLAKRPAPIQIGLFTPPHGITVEGIDIVLGDAVTAETDKTLLGKGQELIVVDMGLVAMEQMLFMPDPNDLPALSNGFVTFGGRCDFAALGPSAAAVWSDILNRVPNSRLMLGNVRTIPEAVRNHAVEVFSQHGVADRLQFWDTENDEQKIIEFFHHIDVFLDSPPVSGFMNLCQGLWMGVPVLTLKGDRRSGQMGASLLMSASQQQWISETGDEMAEKAVSLANDLDELAKTRASLREALKGTALFHPEFVTRAIEDAYVKAMELKKKGKAKSPTAKTSKKPAAPKKTARKPAPRKAAAKKAPAKKGKGAK
ncbi:MAG: tetratricopeptide repeat protein [Proteobacteria bacterium]|nr:tetratricopeptide repeat protein [Pseudomonadota bacterium]